MDRKPMLSSREHGRGIGDLREVTLECGPQRADEEPGVRDVSSAARYVEGRDGKRLLTPYRRTGLEEGVNLVGRSSGSQGA